MAHNMPSVNNEHPLLIFLNERRTQPGQEPTATETTNSLIKGKFTIPDKDYSTFLDLLHKYLFEDGLSVLGLVERDRITKQGKKEVGEKPLLIDLDFKYPTTLNMTRKFNMSHIRGFVYKLTEALNTFFDLGPYSKDGIRFFVCLRPVPYRVAGANPAIKDGIHIESPDFTLNNEKQKVLRAWLLEQHAVKESFEGTEFTEKEEKIFDPAMTRSQGWYFYGESKANSQAQPYALASVFHYSPDSGELTEEEDYDVKYTARELMDILSIRYNLLEDTNEVREEARELYARLLNWRPPTTPGLEGGAGGAVPDLNLNGSGQPPSELDVIVRSMNARNKPGATPEDIPLIRQLVMECLSQDRVEDYGTWMEVAWCLHHIATTPEMSDQMFDLWMEWSRKSTKSSGNNEAQLRRDWNRMTRPTSQRIIKWGSLNYWARTDNPERYAEIMEEDLIQYIATHTMNTHFHIAKIMQKLFGAQYKASIDSKRTEWFMFSQDEHIWKHINQGIELRGKISNEVVDKIAKAKKRIKDQCNDGEGGLSEYGVKRIKELLAVEKSLYTAGFKDSVMKECAGLFYEEDFMTRLNLNPYLLVCANGVLNLRATRKGAGGREEHFVEFRPGRPEDMMSFIAGKEFGISDPICYEPYDPSDPVQADIEDFLSKIFPRADLRQFVKTLLASCLEGMNREQAYYTLIGVGGNGKSKIIELMRMVLGEYQTGLAPTALTRKRPDSGAANPDIMAIKNRRLIYLQEPDDREPLNTSRMKQFSGEDVVEARGLFADQEKFKISGKLMMLCNNLPPIHSMDRGTWRRIRVIPFESKFVKEGDIGYEDLVAGKPNVFPKDTFLDEKLKQWREGFLSLLVWTYENIYCKEGLKEPAIVRQASMDYKNQFDSFAKFKEARIVQVVGERTEFNKITRAYRTWVEWQGGTSKKLTTQDLRKRCEEEFGAPENGKEFRGIVVFDDEEAMETWKKTNSS
jgi:P4 family phage/plasmid primase-like protien